MKIEPVVPQRRHTLEFLKEIRAVSPVFLDTEVDMSRVLEHRDARRESGQRYSPIVYLVYCAARVLAAHPEANSAILGRRSPRVARFDGVDAKVTLDKRMGGHRVVLAAVLAGVDTAQLSSIQQHLEQVRDCDPDSAPQFAPTRLLQRVPWPLRGLLYRRAVRPLRGRAGVFGTFAVTSLGHRAVDGFHSVGGTTVTLGMGRIAERPVVRAGELAIAPTMRLSLAFDHRVIDGAEAADVLTGIKDALESFRDPQDPDTPPAGAIGRLPQGRPATNGVPAASG
ncbi:MAG TPA: 2-oxo acid dehydrogenase subunit E2 [Actinocrinis sp.]|nr:2-oxo acid dehydrogenase subunit E2 [Actinocrinis sp.]